MAIFKEIASILPSSYPSDNAEILIKACARLNYLGYIEDAVEIAKTMLCNKGKKIAMAHFCYQCDNPVWRRDILGIATTLWPDETATRSVIKEVAFDFFSRSDHYNALYLTSILGGDEITVEVFDILIEKYLHNIDKITKWVKDIPDPSLKNRIFLNAVKAYLKEGSKLSITCAEVITTKYLSGDASSEAKELIEKKKDEGSCLIM